MLNIDGLVTGLDTARIIEGLVSIQQTQINRYAARRQEIVDQQTAFANVEARLSGLQSAVRKLVSVQSSSLRRKLVTTSDDTRVKAAVSSNASQGVYQLRVNQLAQSHRVATQGFTSADAEITRGTFEVRVGESAFKKITIDSTNNTLSSLARAINDLGAGVSASVINDGTPGDGAYRLLLTAQKTGQDKVIEVTNNLAASSGDAVRPEIDFDSPVQEAASAEIKIGSGAGAITIQSDTNQLDDVFPGVTLDLLSADPEKDITLTVAQDTEAAVEAITGFADAYNEVLGFIDEQSQFDPESGTSSQLFGNRALRVIDNTLGRSVTSAVAGLNPLINRLSNVGVTLSGDGRLNVNRTRLDEIFGGTVAGVTSEDVFRLFALTGETDNVNFQFVVGSNKTQESPTVIEDQKPVLQSYKIEIISAARQGSVVATNAVADQVTIDATNDKFTISIDDKLSSELSLAHGTYSQLEIAEHLRETINSDSTLLGRSVAVSLENGKLEITSNVYGGSSQVLTVASDAMTSLGFVGEESGKGQNVVGHYIVKKDGKDVIEKATGQGRVLIGNEEKGSTSGLQVRVSLSEAQVGDGVTSNITVTRGIGAKLDQLIGKILDGQNSAIGAIKQEFVQKIESVNKTVERLTAAFEARRESLLRQFAQLESNVGQFQATGNALSAQLASLPSIGRF